jgi:diguanylate cyclase (GGDEF)-like protein
MQWQRANGDSLWVSLSISPFFDASFQRQHLILQATDITARHTAEAQLQRIAYQDALTALPNRYAFNRELDRVLGTQTNRSDGTFAVLFLDFDRFKLINDSLGHSRGDQFLVQAAVRIGAILRPEDMVARLGGDEFAILVQSSDALRSATVLAERLLLALGKPYTLDATEVTSSVSIGITTDGMGYRTPEEVLRDADIAMYKAKVEGKARYVVFDSALHEQVTERVQLESELRRALAEGTLEVAYQPLFDIPTRRIKGFEALARWNHPRWGP